MSLRRALYIAAAIATFISGFSGLFGFAPMIPAYAMAKLGLIMALPFALSVATLLTLVGAFLYLARRPYGWGKLLCLAGFPWIMFSTMSLLIKQQGAPYNLILLGPGLCGTALLVVGLALLAVDWGRPLGRLTD